MKKKNKEKKKLYLNTTWKPTSSTAATTITWTSIGAKNNDSIPHREVCVCVCVLFPQHVHVCVWVCSPGSPLYVNSHMRLHSITVQTLKR